MTLTGTFAATVPTPLPRLPFCKGLPLLADDRVLLTGAVNVCYEPLCADPGTGWSELYDPATGSFSPAGSMKWWNNVYTATLFPSGKVLFAGNGVDDGIPAAAEVFAPSDGTFTAVGSAFASHGYGAATLLPDGTALITGGLASVGIRQVISELFMPPSATFSFAGNMIAARDLHTATLLPDGTVLIAGGFTSSAELYHPAILISAPVLFSLSGDGRAQGAIWHATTGAIAAPGSPAVAGETLSMYTTSLLDGSVIPPQVAVGGRFAEVLYFGSNT